MVPHNVSLTEPVFGVRSHIICRPVFFSITHSPFPSYFSFDTARGVLVRFCFYAHPRALLVPCPVSGLTAGFLALRLTRFPSPAVYMCLTSETGQTFVTYFGENLSNSKIPSASSPKRRCSVHFFFYCTVQKPQFDYNFKCFVPTTGVQSQRG